MLRKSARKGSKFLWCFLEVFVDLFRINNLVDVHEKITKLGDASVAFHDLWVINECLPALWSAYPVVGAFERS